MFDGLAHAGQLLSRVVKSVSLIVRACAGLVLWQGIEIPLQLGYKRGVAGGLGMGLSQGVLYCAYSLAFWFGYVAAPLGAVFSTTPYNSAWRWHSSSV